MSIAPAQPPPHPPLHRCSERLAPQGHVLPCSAARSAAAAQAHTRRRLASAAIMRSGTPHTVTIGNLKKLRFEPTLGGFSVSIATFRGGRCVRGNPSSFLHSRSRSRPPTLPPQPHAPQSPRRAAPCRSRAATATAAASVDSKTNPLLPCTRRGRYANELGAGPRERRAGHALRRPPIGARPGRAACKSVGFLFE